MSGLPSVVTETLVVLPKSSISIELMVRTEDEKHSLFYEFKRKDGWNLKFSSSEYIVFKYNNGNEYENVMASYLHLATLKEGFQEIREFLDQALVYNEANQAYGVDPNYKHGYKLENLIGNKSIAIMPHIRELDNGTQELGCMMMINDPNKSGFVSFDTMMQLCAFIKDFDLYTSSKIMINTMLWYCDRKNNGRMSLEKDPYKPDLSKIPQR